MTRKAAKHASQEPPPPVHRLRREIRGILFFLVALFLAVSLGSYSPTDRLWWNVAGPLGKSKNLFGAFGAHISGSLFQLIGFSSFWFVVIPLVLGFLSFRGQKLASPVKTAVAAVALFVSFAGILSLQAPETVHFNGGTLIPGGLVGLHLAGFAKGVLNRFGAFVLLSATFMISLMLLTRFTWGWLFSKIRTWAVEAIRHLKEILTKRRERKQRSRRTVVAKRKLQQKTKVTIIKPSPEKKGKQEQEVFPFMKAAKNGEISLPPLDLLNDPPERGDQKIQRDSLEANARRLEKKLSDFGVEGEVVEILPGPVITMYEYRPAPGVKISKVAGLADDLALAFRAQSIRIVAPIPGKAAIGIEIPNNKREMVTIKEVFSSAEYWSSRDKLPIALGKDITGSPVVADLAKMPHLLVAGATGAGKSVSINAMINSIVFRISPDLVRFLMIDPKRIELSIYHDIPHLLHPVVTEPKDATRALRWAVAEMERRYMLLSDRGVRNIDAYNNKVLKQPKPKPEEDGSEGTDKILPYLIVVIDELADLMMTSSRDVEEAITRLAQMARAAGIHLIIATQRPSVDVLTGIIKANFPTRISFQVSSKVDSRTILDTIGAEHLLGEGDMLFMPPGVGRIKRIHGPYVSEEEIKRVTDFLRNQRKPDYDETILSEVSRDEEADGDMEVDEKYDQAVEVVLQTGQASISMLQRKLRVGYNRAARMIEVMERDGIVGPSDGVRPREVFGRR